MQLLKANLHNPIRKQLKPATTRALSTTRVSHDLGEQLADGTNSESQTKRKKIVWKENTMKPKTPPKREIVQVDYLRQMKEQHYDPNDPESVKHFQEKRSLKNTWKKEITDDLNQQQKYEIIKDRAKQLEEAALRKEKMLKVTHGGTIKDSDQVNDMIFESIRAKLSILEEINS